MVIQHNIPALNSHRNLGINSNHTAKNLEKLSSGFRINRAGDDAAGLAISEKMRGQIRGLAMAEQNTSNGISLIQTAEGGLNETHAILQRMRELAVQASNGTYQNEDRDQIALELNALKSEVDRIASSTHYNQINLLDGSIGAVDYANGNLGVTNLTSIAMNAAVVGTSGKATIVVNGNTRTYSLMVGDKSYALETTNGVSRFVDENGIAAATLTNMTFTNTNRETGIVSFDFNIAGGNTTVTNEITANQAAATSQLTFQIGANGGADQRVSMRVANMSTGNLGNAAGTIHSIDISTRDNANAAIEVIDAAVNQVSSQRASLGALQNRLEHTLNNLGVTKENLTAAESTIRDVDMAKEMMEFTKNNILVQASQAMLAQANQLPSGVLSLLR